MTIREEYEQLKSYARFDGAVVGGLWILSFAFFIGEFYNPLFSFASLIVGVSSLVVAALRLKRFRDNVLEGVISFSRALLYSMLVYFYAALLMAAAQSRRAAPDRHRAEVFHNEYHNRFHRKPAYIGDAQVPIQKAVLKTMRPEYKDVLKH